MSLPAETPAEQIERLERQLAEAERDAADLYEAVHRLGPEAIDRHCTDPKCPDGDCRWALALDDAMDAHRVRVASLTSSSVAG